MSNPDKPTTDAADAPPAGKSRRRWFAGLAALGGAGLLGVAGAQAHGWGRHDRGPDAMARRMQRRIGRIVEYVGGTPQQKDRLLAITTAAMAELQPLREQGRAARQRAMDLLAAPAIDRAALEQARVAGRQAGDAASRRLVQALADAAEVLSPEQRAKAAQRLRERMQRRRG